MLIAVTSKGIRMTLDMTTESEMDAARCPHCLNQRSTDRPVTVKLWNVHDVAKRLNMSEPHLYRVCADPNSGLPVIRLGRSLRFDPEAVEQWLRESTR